MKAYLYIMIFALLCFGSAGCDDIDPEKAIVGKWKLVAQGPDQDNLKPVEFIRHLEFFPDGTTFMRNGICIYWLDSEHLYINRDSFYSPAMYRYSFSKSRKETVLKLTYIKGGWYLEDIPTIPLVFIYKLEK